MSHLDGIKVGDEALEVYAFGTRHERIRPTTVVTVGRKWISVGTPGVKHTLTRYAKDTGVADGWGNERLYTQASLADARARADLSNQVCRVTTSYEWTRRLTLEQLSRIADILHEAGL